MPSASGPRTITLTLTEQQVTTLLRQLTEGGVATGHSPTVPRREIPDTPVPDASDEGPVDFYPDAGARPAGEDSCGG